MCALDCSFLAIIVVLMYTNSWHLLFSNTWSCFCPLPLSLSVSYTHILARKQHRKELLMKADAQTEAALMATLEQFKQAYEQRDMEHLLALFAPDPDVILIGTGADEKCVGLAEI